MHVNLSGLGAGLAAFLGIWIGHISVREIERRSVFLWQPAAAFLLAGLLLETGALLAPQPPISAILGILGITAGWDALELFRQQRRIQRGHAPANPSNPRHARILAKFPTATTQNLLDHQPLGRPISQDEALSIASGKRLENPE